MKKIIGLFLLSTLLLVSSCKKEPGEGTLAIDFKARINNQPLVFQQFYVINTNDTVEFEELKFYMSDVNITNKDDNATINLSKVALINFKEEATTLNTLLTEGAYKNPSFVFGLTNELNATVPSSYNDTDPLGFNANNYWLMANSYIYFKIEGFRKVNGVNEPFVYHVGADDFNTNKELIKAFSIYEGNTTTVLGLLNINALFANIDFNTESTTHTDFTDPASIVLAQKMLNNFNNALSLE